MRRGVGMVHQHFMLVEPFSVLENLVLGAEPVGGLGAIDLGRARDGARRIAADTGLDLELDRPPAERGVGERQRLEILRVLYRGARAVLLDEPTAVLAPIEVDELYATLRRLAEGGATVAVVTHRLDEIERFCDDVTVMRRGARVLDEALPPAGARAGLGQRLTRAIMGGDAPAPAEPPALGDDAGVALSVEELSVTRPGGTPAVDRLTLQVRAGEVVGVAGVEGNGQRELVRALAGLEPIAGGRVRLGDAELGSARSSAARIRAARAAGLVVVHDDRHKDELLLEASVADNLVVGDLGAVDEDARIPERLRRFDVYPAEPERLAAELSGGNQQKVVMARALDRTIRALVVAQPTRGVDVGTARVIQRALAAAAEAGAAVVVVSADLHELRALAHRIVVLRRGRLVASFAPTATDETIGRAMLGHADDEAAA
jgi:simple sugar transport system ATP-binding protein